MKSKLLLFPASQIIVMSSLVITISMSTRKVKKHMGLREKAEQQIITILKEKTSQEI